MVVTDMDGTLIGGHPNWGAVTDMDGTLIPWHPNWGGTVTDVDGTLIANWRALTFEARPSRSTP